MTMGPIPAPSPFRPVFLAVALIVALVTGCRSSDDAAPVDSALVRDLELAGRDAPIFTPGDTALRTSAPTTVRRTPSRTPTPTPRPTTAARTPTPRVEAPAPVATRPEPAPAAVAEEAGVVVAEEPGNGRGALTGTSLGMVTSGQVCTNNRPGDKLVARVSSVSGPGSGTIPPGSTVVLEVADIQVNESNPEQSRITFRIRSIAVGETDYPGNGATASAEGLEKTSTSSRSSDTKKVIGGAIAGAILGQVLGKDTKGTVIGAAAGAATGAAAAKITRKYEGCLPAGRTLQVTL